MQAKLRRWIFALSTTFLRLTNPKNAAFLLIPKGDEWLMKKDGIKYLLPNKEALGLVTPKARPYQQFHEVARGDIIVDVGACLGEDTLPMARKAGSEGLVISIEVEPENLRHLRRNVTLNQLRNVEIVEKAAWNRKEMLELHLAKSNATPSLVQNLSRDKFVGREIKVQADTLDNIISAYDVERVDLLKFNIEGAEIEALKGAKELLGLTKKVAIATHRRDKGWTTTKVLDLLKKRGFKPKKVKGWFHPWVVG